MFWVQAPEDGKRYLLMKRNVVTNVIGEAQAILSSSKYMLLVGDGEVPRKLLSDDESQTPAFTVGRHPGRAGGSWTPRDNLEIPDQVETYRKLGNHWVRYTFAGRFAKNKTVLDFGCGYGFGSIALTDKCKKYVGVDSDVKAISWANSNLTVDGGRVAFELLSTFEEQDRLKKRFDVILCFEVLEHVQSPMSLLSKLGQNLVEGGIILISTPNGCSSNGEPNLFRSEYHLAEYTPSEVQAIIQASGFSDLHFYEEHRYDYLDVLLLALKRRNYYRRLNHLKVRGEDYRIPATKLKPWDIGGPWLRFITKTAFTLFDKHLNRPFFWAITDVGDSPRECLRYSTILVMAKRSS